jgi:hypothetical protein
LDPVTLLCKCSSFCTGRGTTRGGLPAAAPYPYTGAAPPRPHHGLLGPISISSTPVCPGTPHINITTSTHGFGQRRQPDTPEEEVAARRAWVTSAAGMSYTGTDEGTRRKFEENAGHRFDVGRMSRKRTAREAEDRPYY